MRVLFDFTIFESQAVGGMSKYVVRLAEHLQLNRLADTRVIAPVHINAHLANADRISVAGVRIPAVPKTGIARRNINRALFGPLARRFQPEILHDSGYRPTAPRGGARARVVTVHDMTYEVLKQPAPGDPRWAQKRLAVEQADMIICVSEATRRDFLTWFPGTESKTAVVHHGVDPPRPAIALTRPPRPFVLHVGRRAGYKNFDALLLAFAQCPQARGLDLIAVGGGNWTATERAALHRLGLQKRVHQRVASDGELAVLYRQAELLVYPSLREGFGLPPLEAMAQRCPAICVAASAMPEVCGDAAEYAYSGDPEALADAMARVLGSPDRRRSLIEKGERRAATFTWSRCAMATAQVYSGLL